tara:strand:- start:10 stop:165 length:156 start_codon:yes stop_codon:yes gene_type:complete
MEKKEPTELEVLQRIDRNTEKIKNNVSFFFWLFIISISTSALLFTKILSFL